MSVSEKDSNGTVEASIVDEGFIEEGFYEPPSSEEEEDTTPDEAMMVDVMAYVGALLMCETMFQEKVDERDELLNKLESKITNLNKVIARQTKSIRKLCNNLNYYKRKSQDESLRRKNESLSLDAAVVKAVNELLDSQQRYKLMSRCAIAKGVFSPDFGGGVALPEIMKEAKLWLRRNVFSPVKILKQMDLRGGTLNYEGLTVLNDVESAAMPCGKRRLFGRLLPMPSCLQEVANILKKSWTKALSLQNDFYCIRGRNRI
jgi:hypothetical protein